MVAGKGVSVIICCYNSARRLPQTLLHLAQQVVPPGFCWEIIVVDNASADHTRPVAAAIAEKFINKKEVVFKMIDEPLAGQMQARKKGAVEAAYECLVFCDDDNWLAPEYVYHAYEMVTQNTKLGAGGGQNTPVTDAANYPAWFEEYKDKYAIGIPAKKTGDVTCRGFVLGAGLTTKRSLFLQMYEDKYPSLLTGRTGEKLSTGDDFEYCKRLLLRGYQLYYDEGMKLEHFIPKERLTLDYRDRLMQGIDEAGSILNEYDLAIKFYKKNKHKSRMRLLLLTPFRILLARFGLINRNVEDEQLTLFYLSPFASGNNATRLFIKRFIYNK